MDNEDKNFVMYPASSVDTALSLLKNISGIQLLAGATLENKIKSDFFSVLSIAEMTAIDKKERYIDVGAAVSLSALLDLGEGRIPSVLYEAIKTIGTPFTRNLATIGGNICASSEKFKYTLYAPLLALDARLEIRTPSELPHNILLSRLTVFPEKFLLSKIRIPLEDWNVSIFRRVGREGILDEKSASFTFLAKMEKDVISKIAIAFAGSICFRNKELENTMQGLKLPLSDRQIEDLSRKSAEILASAESKNSYVLPSILKSQYLNLIRYSLEQLS